MIRATRALLVVALVTAGGTLALAGCSEAEPKPAPTETKPAPGTGAGGLNPDGG